MSVLITPRGVPQTAWRGHFKAHNGNEGYYWVWQRSANCWYWQTNSNNGEEATEDLAKEAARKWIRGT
jgi:hypothetical protein